MSGNTLGLLFTITSFGESHGPAMGCVIDGCPPRLYLNETDIQTELNRRRPGMSSYVSQRREPDTVEILSGIFEGQTTGAPIALLIRNQDARSQDYGEIAKIFRPGHADYTYWKKYGIRDPRGGGRASARETVVRVAAGAIAKKWLRERLGLNIRGYMAQIGEINIPFKSWEAVTQNPFFSPNEDIVPQLEAYLNLIRAQRDSVGARITVVAENVPTGLGEPVYDRLDAEIAYAMMGINAVKGVEIGSGFKSTLQRGSEHGDELTPQGFVTNNAGGTLGGISSGQDIRVDLALKPTPSIPQARRSIDLEGHPVSVSTGGRHDPCVGMRAIPVAEAMLALVLMDHALRLRAQCGSIPGYIDTIPIVFQDLARHPRQ